MKFVILSISLVALFFANLFVGSVDIPPAQVVDILFNNGDPDGPLRFIVVGSRLPQAITAVLAGAALTVSGLMLQTAFSNPLAGPSILGITSGSSLGVALVILFSEGQFLPQVILGADTRLYWQDRLQAVSRSWVCCSCFPCGLKMT